MTEDETNTTIYENECSCCFLVWEGTEENPLCDYCREKPYLMLDHHRDKRLDRVLHVMDHAKIYRVREVLRLIVDTLRDEIYREDEE